MRRHVSNGSKRKKQLLHFTSPVSNLRENPHTLMHGTKFSGAVLSRLKWPLAKTMQQTLTKRKCCLRNSCNLKTALVWPWICSAVCVCVRTCVQPTHKIIASKIHITSQTKQKSKTKWCLSDTFSDRFRVPKWQETFHHSPMRNSHQTNTWRWNSIIATKETTRAKTYHVLIACLCLLGCLFASWKLSFAHDVMRCNFVRLRYR